MKTTNLIKKTHQKGFTLIELLVVIFIIGILASLILANILGARQRAEDIQRKNDLQQLQKALRLYYNDYQRYPETSVIEGQTRFEVGDTVYMARLPEEYEYYVDADEESFRLVVTLDNISDKDVLKSQEKCPIMAGVPEYTDASYVVCEF